MRRPIGLWLLACCALIWAILVTGGVTRLTRSGLSIVEWKPVTGVLPPVGERQWAAEFEKYRGTPEFSKVNAAMDVEGFKAIYWMEYAHRLLGRAAGLAFVIPLVFFAVKRRVDAVLGRRLILIAALWACQGALGWFMVASGLIDVPRVSHYRLTAHLLTACLLFMATFTTAFEVLRPRGPRAGGTALRPALTALAGLLFVTIASGGLVAGLRAGLVYNTFPLMAGHWVPPFLLADAPLWRNFFDNVVTVQFDHRLLGAALVAAAIGVWLAGWRAPRSGRGRAARHAVLALTVLQATLGLLALLWKVPVGIGAAHQANALLLLGAVLAARHEA